MKADCCPIINVWVYLNADGVPIETELGPHWTDTLIYLYNWAPPEAEARI